jgi:hypothetical protein
LRQAGNQFPEPLRLPFLPASKARCVRSARRLNWLARVTFKPLDRDRGFLADMLSATG